MPASASPSPYDDGADGADFAPSPGLPTDLTEVAALRLAYDRLQQQYHSLAAFLGTASHELRAPINQVISLHQLILEDLCESPDEEREFIAQANQAITRILKNLDTLIGLSKLDIGALEPAASPISLAKVLATVRQFTEMQCTNRHCRFAVNPGPEPPQVLTDERWLTQALLVWVEAALVSGSTAISLNLLESQGSTVVLGLTCNAPVSQWPPPRPDLSALPHTQEQGGFHRSLSPGFGYHLAHRLLAHLHSPVRSQLDSTTDQHTLIITLPKADQGT